MAHSTKPCKYCFQEIDSRARKCPHCLTLQGALAVIVFVAFVIIASVGILVFTTPNVILNMPSNAVDSPMDLIKEIEVVQSELVFGQLQGGLTVGTIGMLKNHTDVRVNVSTLEVQHYDASGKLIDVSMESYFGIGITIAPRGEATFEISKLADQPKDSYASYKVFVRDARIPNRFE